ncbi:hypothetical protein OSTOST_08467 [Ostertagia ostertagi]
MLLLMSPKPAAQPVRYQSNTHRPDLLLRQGLHHLSILELERAMSKSLPHISLHHDLLLLLHRLHPLRDLVHLRPNLRHRERLNRNRNRKKMHGRRSRNSQRR